MPPVVPPAPAIRFSAMKRILAFAALAAVVALPALAGEASGQFKAGSRPPIKPKYAIAYETRDQHDARIREIVVILSDVPLDGVAAAAEIDPLTPLLQPALRGRDVIVLAIIPDGNLSMNAMYARGTEQFLDSTHMSLKAEMTTNTPALVAGRVFTPIPVTLRDGQSWSVDVTFATEVSRVPNARKLPAGGGEPGRALQALLSAMNRESDFAGIEKRVPASMFETLRDAMRTLTTWLPIKGTITGGELRGDVAVLDVEGELYEGTKELVLVKMVKDERGWIYHSATRIGILDERPSPASRLRYDSRP